MGVLGAIGTTIGGKVGHTIWNTAARAYDDWQSGRSNRLAITIGADGSRTMLPNEGFIWGTVYEDVYIEQPIYLTGGFIADEDLADFLDDILEHDERTVLIFSIDEETNEVILAEFDFDGYVIPFWPGRYSIYAFIIDPVLDEILAIGYLDSGDEQDPNPVEILGTGTLALNFILFDAED